jgi:hypothetical protein
MEVRMKRDVSDSESRFSLQRELEKRASPIQSSLYEAQRHCAACPLRPTHYLRLGFNLAVFGGYTSALSREKRPHHESCLVAQFSPL